MHCFTGAPQASHTRQGCPSQSNGYGDRCLALAMPATHGWGCGSLAGFPRDKYTQCCFSSGKIISVLEGSVELRSVPHSAAPTAFPGPPVITNIWHRCFIRYPAELQLPCCTSHRRIQLLSTKLTLLLFS